MKDEKPVTTEHAIQLLRKDSNNNEAHRKLNESLIRLLNHELIFAWQKSGGELCFRSWKYRNLHEKGFQGCQGVDY